MIEYFEYYQHWHSAGSNESPSKLARAITVEQAEGLKKEGLPAGEYLVGPYTGMRNKEDEKEKEQV